jgi:hypothetical protein
VKNALLTRPVFAPFFAAFFFADEARPGGLLAGRAGADVTRFVQAKHQEFLLLMRQIVEVDNVISSIREQLQQERTPERAAEAYATLFRSVTQLLTTAEQLVPPDFADGKVARVSSFIGSASELYTTVVSREYGRAVVIVVKLIEDNAVQLSADQLRYLSFAANLATAQRAEEVTAALDAAAEPVGAYRAKRGERDTQARRFAFTVNGYVGASAGVEQAEIPGGGTDRGNYAGLAVPFGLELAYAFKNSSLSLFVPVIDVGTIASARFNGDDEVESQPEVGFQQVFTPGIYLVWGITESKPISLGLGLQRVPKLREVEEGEPGAGDKVDVRRFSAVLAVDVPVFRF